MGITPASRYGGECGAGRRRVCVRGRRGEVEDSQGFSGLHGALWYRRGERRATESRDHVTETVAWCMQAMRCMHTHEDSPVVSPWGKKSNRVKGPQAESGFGATTLRSRRCSRGTRVRGKGVQERTCMEVKGPRKVQVRRVLHPSPF